MEYIKKVPKEPNFKQKGLSGYCYPLDSKEISITLEDCFKGHDKYCKNPKHTMFYYILEGDGVFSINGTPKKVEQGDIVEIPANTEFVFKGNMKVLFINTPAYQKGDCIEEKENDLYGEGE